MIKGKLTEILCNLLWLLEPTKPAAIGLVSIASIVVVKCGIRLWKAFVEGIFLALEGNLKDYWNGAPH